MSNKISYKNYIIPVICALLLAGSIYAAPNSTYMRTILPEVNSLYWLGSSSNYWNRLYANYASSTAISASTICIGTDCQTSWPAGGSGGSDFTFAETFGVLSAATSSPLWLQGAFYSSSTAYFQGDLYTENTFSAENGFQIYDNSSIIYYSDKGITQSGFLSVSANQYSFAKGAESYSAKLDTSNITTNQIFTFPDKSLTFAGIANETFTGLTTFGNASGTQLTIAPTILSILESETVIFTLSSALAVTMPLSKSVQLV